MIKNYALLYIFFAMHSMHAMEITHASKTVRERHPAEAPPSSGICYLLNLPSEMRSSIAEYLVRGELERRLIIKAQVESKYWFFYSSTADPDCPHMKVDPDGRPFLSCPLLLGRKEGKDACTLLLNTLHCKQCDQIIFLLLDGKRLVRQSQADGLIKLADMPNPRCLYTLEYKKETNRRCLVTRVCNELGVWVEKRRRELPAEREYSSILVGTEIEGVGLLGKDGRVDIIKDINYKKDHLFKLFASMGVF